MDNNEDLLQRVNMADCRSRVGAHTTTVNIDSCVSAVTAVCRAAHSPDCEHAG